MDFLNTGYTGIPFMVQLAQWGIPLKVRTGITKCFPLQLIFWVQASFVWCHTSRLFWEGERNSWVEKCGKKGKKQGLKSCVFCIDAIAALPGAAGWRDLWLSWWMDFAVISHTKKHPSECPLQDFRDQVIPQQYQGQIFMSWPWIWLFPLPAKWDRVLMTFSNQWVMIAGGFVCAGMPQEEFV